MTTITRKRKILEFLSQNEEMEVTEMAKYLEVSDITIRRDLIDLESKGLLIRTHGGAVKIDENIAVSFQDKSVKNAKEKDFICQLASKEIQEGDVIFIDCGSTTFELCKYIREKKIHVITNSLPVVNALAHSKVKVNLIGGELDTERMAMHGMMAVEHIRKYQATKAFIGVDGLTTEGLFAHSEKEAEISLNIAAQAAQTYLLCDASKIGKKSYLNFGGIGLLHTLITNADDQLASPFRTLGLPVLNK